MITTRASALHGQFGRRPSSTCTGVRHAFRNAIRNLDELTMVAGRAETDPAPQMNAECREHPSIAETIATRARGALLLVLALLVCAQGCARHNHFAPRAFVDSVDRMPSCSGPPLAREVRWIYYRNMAGQEAVYADGASEDAMMSGSLAVPRGTVVSSAAGVGEDGVREASPGVAREHRESEERFDAARRMNAPAFMSAAIGIQNGLAVGLGAAATGMIRSLMNDVVTWALVEPGYVGATAPPGTVIYLLLYESVVSSESFAGYDGDYRATVVLTGDGVPLEGRRSVEVAMTTGERAPRPGFTRIPPDLPDRFGIDEVRLGILARTAAADLDAHRAPRGERSAVRPTTSGSTGTRTALRSTTADYRPAARPPIQDRD